MPMFTRLPARSCVIALAALAAPLAATAQTPPPSLASPPAPAQSVIVHVDARAPGKPLSRTLTGVCIEDVNHEIYGGLSTQLLFGESFQEPAADQALAGARTFGGTWSVTDGELAAGDGGPGDDGPKLVLDGPDVTTGAAGVDVWMDSDRPGNAGLIVKVASPAAGADAFEGYEISLDLARHVLVLGQHRRDFRRLKEAPCDAQPGRWVSLSVKMTERTLEAFVDGHCVLTYEEHDRPMISGRVGLRQWQRPARYRRLWVQTGDARTDVPFLAAPAGAGTHISGAWDAIAAPGVQFSAAIESADPFTGAQSQRLTFTSGAGEAGIANSGLNRRGIGFEAAKPYEGSLWIKADHPQTLRVTCEDRAGKTTFAETTLAIDSPTWKRYDFTLTPSQTDPAGRFTIRLSRAGSIVVGYAVLQPGGWARFKGLPVRRDVAQAMIDQGITVVRYGGSMVNAAGYRWKKMIGPPEHRPPFLGTWYPYSSNRWGIVDFMNFCEAAGFVGIPDLNINETPQDMADFVEYMNGPPDSPWGQRRAADGHRAPYGLTHVELGNEERIDEHYYERFEPIALAMWAKDPKLILVVGDFAYNAPIPDAAHVTHADSHITNLDAQRKILALAKAHNREVWFDVHVWTEGPGPEPSLRALPSFIDAIDSIADGAAHKVAVFEFNSSNHAQRRALGNALALNAVIRDARVPVVCVANGLQPDGQNDNGWDQGLFFLNTHSVWVQPPGYVERLYSRGYQPTVLPSTVSPADAPNTLDVAATRSDDGSTITLRVVNTHDQPVTGEFRITGFTRTQAAASAEELAGPLAMGNTASEPARITPRKSQWPLGAGDEPFTRTFPPRSVTLIRLH